MQSQGERRGNLTHSLRLRTVRAALIVAVALSLLPVASPAHAAPTERPTPSVGIRLLDVTADQLHDSRARSYIVANVQPGQTFERHIEVSNPTDASTKVTVYGGAARISGGNWVSSAPGEQNSLSRWTAVDEQQLSLAPHASARVTVATKVPTNATSGERYAVVWAQQESAGNAPGEVLVRSWVGVRMYVVVSHGAAATNFTINQIQATTAAGHRQVSASVQNTGDRAVDLSGTISLSHGPASTSAGPFATKQTLILAPGQSGTARFALPRALAAGPWRAHVVLRSGEARRSLDQTIRFDTALPSSHRTAPVMWVAGGAVLLIAVLLMSVFLWRQRAHRETSEPV